MQKNEKILETVMPSNRDAEMAVLGSMILTRESVGDVSLIIRGDDFYSENHREIFYCLQALYDKNADYDLVILREHLERNDVLDRVGGIEYIVRLAETVPSAANAEYYAQIVRDKAIQRRMIESCTRIIKEARDNPEDIGEFLDSCEQKIFDIAERGQSSCTESIQDLLKSVLKKIDDLQHVEGGGRITGLPTRYRELDKILDGLHTSELTILAARPSMGKTSLALNIADNVATRGGDGVLIFSCEMAREQISQNMLCANARIDAHRMRRGNLNENDWEELPPAADRLSRSPIFIDDTPGLSVMGLRAKARRICARHDIKLIIVDYLQLLTYSGRADNRQMEITYISQALKHLAREMQVPVLALSQLNRSVASRVDKRPLMSDLRESGSIEQDADVILFLFREAYYAKDSAAAEEDNTAEVIVAKQRNGPTGKVKLLFFPQYLRFEEIHFVAQKKSQSSDEFSL